MTRACLKTLSTSASWNATRRTSLGVLFLGKATTCKTSCSVCRNACIRVLFHYLIFKGINFRPILAMCRQSLVATFFTLILVAKVSSHWLPPSAVSKEKSTSSHDLFGDTASDFLTRNVRDIDHCGPDDPIPPNRVNTTEQVL